MDISNKTIEELKAIAYDLIVSIDGYQKNLNIINARIAKLSGMPKEEKEVSKKEDKKS